MSKSKFALRNFQWKKVCTATFEGRKTVGDSLVYVNAFRTDSYMTVKLTVYFDEDYKEKFWCREARDFSSPSEDIEGWVSTTIVELLSRREDMLRSKAIGDRIVEDFFSPYL